MFDPTAFDNMKVVMEGALYDLDIRGDIVITDRNDMVNMAKMSRVFNVGFKLPENKVTAIIEMESRLVNLAAELIPSSEPHMLAGCYVRLQFSLEGAFKTEEYKQMQGTLCDIWGETRTITQSVQFNPLSSDLHVKRIVFTVDFDRLISEDQMDDLVEMTDFMISTLQCLESFVN